MSSASHRPFVMEVDEIDPLEIRNAGPLLGTDGPILQSVFGPLPQDNAREPSVRTNSQCSFHYTSHIPHLMTIVDVDGPPAASSYPSAHVESEDIFLPVDEL
jgi:hypothetical protein